MMTLFGRHRVADYEAWRKVSDAHVATRRQAGVISEAIYQSADDPNDVTLTFDFETLEAARAFPDNEELKAAFRDAGSVGPPTIWFATKV